MLVLVLFLVLVLALVLVLGLGLVLVLASIGTGWYWYWLVLVLASAGTGYRGPEASYRLGTRPELLSGISSITFFSTFPFRGLDLPPMPSAEGQAWTHAQCLVLKEMLGFLKNLRGVPS